MKIRRCSSSSDYESALAIRRKVFIEEQGVAENIEIDGNEESATHFLLSDGGKEIAVGRWRVKGGLLKFERIAVLPAERGKGAAKALMRYMQQLGARVYPAKLQFLHAQAAVVKFYEKLGWTTVGPKFAEAGLVHRMMVFVPPHPEQIADLECWKDPGTPVEVLKYLRGLGSWMPQR